MAAVFSSIIGQTHSASPIINFRQFGRIPARGIMVNSSPVRRTFSMAAMTTSTDKVGDDNSIINKIDDPQVIVHPPPYPREELPPYAREELPERDFTGTPYVPIYVTLPLDIINMEGEIVDVDGLLNQLKTLKSTNIDGVTIECWWGIVEAHAPHRYNWSGYKRLFKIVRELNLKLRVIMSFHEGEGSVGDDTYIPLPRWITEIGYKNPDIFFTDRALRRNHECLTWGIDKERVLSGRSAVEVYFDLMRSFRMVFDEFFENGTISQIEIGLGPRGELRYPSHSAKFGWKYPGIGEFQCYDKYLYKSLQKEAESCGSSSCGRGPENAGFLNSKPQQTGFFCDGGEFDRGYGRFFLKWYSQVLLDHADQVLGMANLAFKGTPIAAKLPGIHWWHNTDSHAAELTAGLYSNINWSGYHSIASVLKKYEATLNFTSLELRTLDENKEFPEALADPGRLAWQVLNAAWYTRILAAGENAHPCYHREGYIKILENSKPLGDVTGRFRLTLFTYSRLGPTLLEKHNLMEFERFVQKMHGL